MDNTHIQHFHSWFATYVKSFYSNDPNIQTHIVLKELHTLRVSKHCRTIGQSLDFDNESLNLAEAVGLFHDIGRFRQFQQYKTFNDWLSVNHGKLGGQILKETDILKTLTKSEQATILKSVICHNMRELPERQTDSALLFPKLIRDADKLDIFDLLTANIPDSQIPPSPEIAQTTEFSPQIITDILRGNMAHFEHIRTQADQVLFRMSWVYNLYFPVSAAYMLKQQHLDKLIEPLPNHPDILRVANHLKHYLEAYASNTL